MLNTETLIKIITDLDVQVSILDKKLHEVMSYEAMSSAEIGDLQIMLDKAYRDYEDMNKTRQYWKDKAKSYELQLKEAGLLKSIQRKQPEKKTKKEFKISIIRDGHRVDINDFPKRNIKIVEPNIDIEEDIKVPEFMLDEVKEYTQPGKGHKHNIGSNKGVPKGTKHSGHKSNDEVLMGIFPKGEVKYFDSVNQAKKYIRKNYKEFEDSSLTNISRAARGADPRYHHHMAYNIKWEYKNKSDKYTVDGIEII